MNPVNIQELTENYTKILPLEMLESERENTRLQNIDLKIWDLSKCNIFRETDVTRVFGSENKLLTWSKAIDIAQTKSDITKLDLSSNYITDADMDDVLNLVNALGSCIEIDLSFNLITRESEPLLKLLDSGKIVILCHTQFSNLVF